MIGLKRWLEKIDLGIQAMDTTDKKMRSNVGVIHEIEGRMMEELNPQMAKLRGIKRAMFHLIDQPRPQALCETSNAPAHAFVRPFAYRAYTKPLGYAGDYEVVNMMMRDPYEGGLIVLPR